MASRRGPDNSVRLSINMTLAGTVTSANVFAAQLTVSGTPTQANLDTWLTAAALAFKTRFASQMSNSVAFVSARAVLYTPGGGALESQVSMTGNGSGGTTVQDNSAAGVVSWLTSVYWRGGKPRTYIGSLPNTFLTNASQLTGAAITSLKAAAQGFRTDMNALTAGAITATSLGFVSFFTGNALRTPPLFFAFNDATVHTRIGTQRRRLGPWLQ